MPILVGKTGLYTGKAIRVRRNVTFGFDRACDIPLSGEGIGKVHAILQFREGNVFIRDMGCMAGTYVSDRRVKEFKLKEGDRIEIGEHAFAFKTADTLDGKPASPVKEPAAPVKKPRPLTGEITVRSAEKEPAEAAVKKPAAAPTAPPKPAPPEAPEENVETDMALRIATGAKKGEEIPVACPFYIGSGASNSLILREKDVAEKHARIFARGGRMYIEDSGSHVGTLVNFEHISRSQELFENDVITIGITSLEFRLGRGAVEERAKESVSAESSPEAAVQTAPPEKAEPPAQSLVEDALSPEEAFGAPSEGTAVAAKPAAEETAPEETVTEEPAEEAAETGKPVLKEATADKTFEEFIAEKSDDEVAGPQAAVLEEVAEEEHADVSGDRYVPIKPEPFDKDAGALPAAADVAGKQAVFQSGRQASLDLDTADVGKIEEIRRIKPARISVSFTSEEENQNYYQETLSSFLDVAGLPEDEQDHLHAAVREAVTNAAKHGNKFNSSRRVRVESERLPNKIVVAVSDEGPGFEHRKYTSEIGSGITAVTSARQRILEGGEGGIGLILISKTVDRFYFNEAGNRLVIEKNITTPGKQGE
jgi:anti-sigma regulatory factor (Ser/Thr protein kinase)/pSer/pThr/pTyr-binding forkhead associated (FHA) protein